jgi:hypothetical protein
MRSGELSVPWGDGGGNVFSFDAKINSMPSPVGFLHGTNGRMVFLRPDTGGSNAATIGCSRNQAQGTALSRAGLDMAAGQRHLLRSRMDQERPRR